MAWWLPAMAVGSAIMGGQQAKAQNKARERQNMAAAAQTEWSPWTGMGQGQIDTSRTDPMAAALQGGLGGFMQGQNIQNAMTTNAANQGLADVAGGGQGDVLGGGSALNTNDPFGSAGLDNDPYNQMRKQSLYMKS